MNKLKINEKVNKRIKIRRKTLKRLLEKYSKKKSGKKVLLYRSKYKWEDVVISSAGTVNIRCQAKLYSTKKITQCRAKAVEGKLFCRVHGGRKQKEQKQFDELKNVYLGKEFKGLQGELQSLENLSPEELQDTSSELKVAISLLRAFLKRTTDEQITRNPGQLMYIIGEIARLKKEHYEVKHAKNVSFTREQVMLMFIHFQNILIEVIKEEKMLKEISSKMKEVGQYIEGRGFIEK